MDYIVKNEKVNIKDIQKITDKAKIINIDSNMNKSLTEIFDVIHERTRTTTDQYDFQLSKEKAKVLVKNKKFYEEKRIRRQNEIKDKAGFALTSVLVTLGVTLITCIIFITIKKLLF